MAIRIEKRIGALVTGCLLWASASFGQQALRYEVQYARAGLGHGANAGVLIVTDSGVSFDQTYREGKKPRHPHNWRWDYKDIQQLTIAAQYLTVLTYRDNKWRLGADRSYEFQLASEGTFDAACQMLKTRLDERFVAAIAEDRAASFLWELPVKHLLSFGGDEGTLRIGDNGVSYRSAAEGQSRSWRFQDIDNIGTSGPFDLTITTFERARMHYGDRKAFHFELRQRLEEAQYDQLWLKVNRSKGLTVLNAYRQ